MHPTLKAWARDWLPPIAVRSLRRPAADWVSWHGDYPSWEDAVAASTGYDQPAILEKVMAGTLKVMNGEAACERDSVVFAEPQYSWPLLAALMWVAATHGARISVLDFGGSLGSSYFQHRRWLDDIGDVLWGVVEQSHFVACGRRYIQSERLRFYETAQECADDIQPQMAVLSGVLQTVPNPLQVIDTICAMRLGAILVDRTGFVPVGHPERVTVQTVREPIYGASYPCRFFSEGAFVDRFQSGGYQLFASFPALDRANVPSYFKGFLFVRDRPRDEAEP